MKISQLTNVVLAENNTPNEVTFKDLTIGHLFLVKDVEDIFVKIGELQCFPLLGVSTPELTADTEIKQVILIKTNTKELLKEDKKRYGF